ncbi:proline-rich protein 11-like [Planoprotostelium fungivorum]|uniref:Proline-rich protein 11-like n=1 Tax=Planoprotostelium fungivorum TaxID=1890364 RepID=A0A2P6N4A1_9EUKA|nr:proline-rich protein 11-like [Planoprotostelium fungivorum]
MSSSPRKASEKALEKAKRRAEKRRLDKQVLRLINSGVILKPEELFGDELVVVENGGSPKMTASTFFAMIFFPFYAIGEMFCQTVIYPFELLRAGFRWFVGASQLSNENAELIKALHYRIARLEVELQEMKTQAVFPSTTSTSVKHSSSVPLPPVQPAQEEVFAPAPPPPMPPPLPPPVRAAPTLIIRKKTEAPVTPTGKQKSFSISVNDIQNIKLRSRPLSDLTNNVGKENGEGLQPRKIGSLSKKSSPQKTGQFVTSPTKIVMQARLLRRVNKSPGGTPQRELTLSISPREAPASPYIALQKRMMLHKSPIKNIRV